MPDMNNHPLFGKRYFKQSYYIFSVFKRTDEEWWLYARHEHNHDVHYLGKIKRDSTEVSPIRVEWSVVKGGERLFDLALDEYSKYNRLEKVVDELDKRTHLCNNETMPSIEKTDRNRRIIELVEKGKSYTEIGKIMRIKSKGTIGRIVKRDWSKYAKKKLSPYQEKKGLAPFALLKYTKSTKR